MCQLLKPQRNKPESLPNPWRHPNNQRVKITKYPKR